jgi:hypothetical protein
MHKALSRKEIKEIILTELPKLIKKDLRTREFILQLAQERFADKKKTEDRFEALLKEIKSLREEGERRWEETRRWWNENLKKWKENEKRWQETQAEWNRRWEESRAEWNRKWQETQAEWNKKWQETQAEWNKKWQETQAEWNKKWQETQAEWNKKWEENEKKWQETQAEWNRKWQETQAEWNKKWQETQAEWNKKWEENEKRWQETQAEWNRRWEESHAEWNKRWEENQKVINKMLEEIKLLRERQEAESKRIDRKFDITIGALGARWGLRAEGSFRNAIKGILEESFPVKVERYHERDEEGVVFGRPDQVELDLIIKNGEVIVAEIKSSISKGDVAIFIKKVEFFIKKEGRPVSRKILISPMIDSSAKEFAESSGIEIYSYPEELNLQELQNN